MTGTYGKGIRMVTSCNSKSVCFSSYSMFTSHPLPVSFGQQLTTIDINDSNIKYQI